jgi:YVTN family beta-propeller protein
MLLEGIMRVKSAFRMMAVSGAVLFSSVAMAQGTASLLVLSKTDHTLAIVDPITLKVLGRVPVGNDPHEVIASSDGRMAYVSNYGFGAFHTLAVVDLSARKAMPSIELGPMGGAHGLTFAGGKVWFTSEIAKAFGRYDPAAGKIDMIVGNGQNRIHMIYVSPDLHHVVTTNVNSGTVTLADEQEVNGPPPPAGAPSGVQQKKMDWNETTVKVGPGSEGFDISPDGREIWVGNAQDGTISVIDRASKSVVATLPANVKSVNRVKFTPDGGRVLVSMLNNGSLAVIDARTRQEVKRVEIGHGAAGIFVQPDGKRAFVSCSPDNYVAVIDLATLTVVGKIDAGGNPDGLAWAVR